MLLRLVSTDAEVSSHVDADVPLDGGARVVPLTPTGLGSASRSDTKSTPALGAAPDADLDRPTATDQMADAMMRLARRNEVLQDFAALVAHELKSPLEAALLADDPRTWIVSALDLVESLLGAATESSDGAWATLADCLAHAACCVQPLQLTVAAEEDARFPLPSSSLSVILRNLLANAAAANARRVNVFTAHRHTRWWLVVDDDGVGLGAADDQYDHGSGIGLELCRRIAGRHGAALELVTRRDGGTRAILTLERAG
jgi:signal transduction histidine kinase